MVFCIEGALHVRIHTVHQIQPAIVHHSRNIIIGAAIFNRIIVIIDNRLGTGSNPHQHDWNIVFIANL